MLMSETSLQIVQRLVAEGRSTDEIRQALNQSSVGSGSPVSNQTASVAESSESSQLRRSADNDSIQHASSGIGATRPASDGDIGGAPTLAGTAVIPPASVLGQLESSYMSKLGWPLVGLICLIPAFALLFDASWSVRFGSLSRTLLTTGDVTGVIGLGMYAMDLALATRLRWFEDIFGGLNRVLMSHQILGGLALVMLLIHPMLTAISYYPYGIHTVANFFIPQTAYIGTAFGIVALVVMIGLVGVSYYARLGYKVWLASHKYLGVAYVLVALHVLLTPNHITANLFVRWYLYGLLVVGVAAYVYRTLLPNIFVRRYIYTITSAVAKGIGVVEVTLSPVADQVHFKAGQFIFVSFGGDGFSEEWHPFSISSAESSGLLMLDVKSLGGYTEALTRMLPHMVGMTARVEGAYGRFSYRNFDNQNQVWIAGGIGITPFLSMAQSLGQGSYNIDLYYSVKTASELVDLDVLAVHQSAAPGQVFRTFPFITETYKTYLSANIIQKNSADITKRDFLLCGPPGMMGAIRQQLIELGVSNNQIHSEEFALE
jgi:predicted ferric reductase